ncbi:GNAT family N-acetyltransferase [Polaromonas sp.]|uniref:GNAT family N-acetyltransferase n=1 Tax=Polaromonas sp. TaxID=1869339 RepID=UPI00352A6BC2
MQNDGSGASKTYVVCADGGMSVIGYYALATGAVDQQDAPGSIKRNMPSPIPVIVLGRLAVHREWAGKGIGKGLLKDATLRAMQAAQLVGVRALLCHSIDEEAKAFYIKHGFVASPINPLTVMTKLSSK